MVVSPFPPVVLSDEIPTTIDDAARLRLLVELSIRQHQKALPQGKDAVSEAGTSLSRFCVSTPGICVFVSG